jgi:pentatricopeptide repeat protein
MAAVDLVPMRANWYALNNGKRDHLAVVKLRHYVPSSSTNTPRPCNIARTVRRHICQLLVVVQWIPDITCEAGLAHARCTRKSVYYFHYMKHRNICPSFKFIGSDEFTSKYIRHYSKPMNITYIHPCVLVTDEPMCCPGWLWIES